MRRKFFIFGLISFLVSCAVITVNIYFPEKDVKEAYKSLEDELMKPEKPQKGKSDKKQSILNIDIVTPLYAQEEGLAKKITETIKKMPEVIDAYRRMGGRLEEIDRLRDSGVVGEGNNGLLLNRSNSLSEEERKLIQNENEDRKIVMKGMAKAIVKINGLPDNESNIKQVMPQAIKQFVSVKREKAKSGWWIQDDDGKWYKK
jgi:uncharacterized protein YdbL (DUF1318 family)